MRFKKGQIPWNKGKTSIYSVETIEKMRLSKKGNIPWDKGLKRPDMSQKLKGIKRTKKTKLKLSETRKRLFREGKIIHPKGMLGKKHSEETKIKFKNRKAWNKGLTKNDDERIRKYSEKLSTIKKGVPNLKLKGTKRPWASKNLGKYSKLGNSWRKGKGELFKGGKNYFFGKHHSEETKQKLREKRLTRIIPSKDTLPERMLQDSLKVAGIDFMTHKSILGQPDIFIEPNICIFADGCYWHGCEQCMDRNKLESWIRGKRVKDELITQKLINDGYIVLRFWEHEIHGDIDSCISQIKKCVEGVKIVGFQSPVQQSE